MRCLKSRPTPGLNRRCLTLAPLLARALTENSVAVLLTWDERRAIINALHEGDLVMNTRLFQLGVLMVRVGVVAGVVLVRTAGSG